MEEQSKPDAGGMPPRFDPAELEQRIYRAWEASGAFTPTGRRERRFSIVIPPPNVTGRLHVGHALVNTLQDVLVRWRRMKGDDVLWLPGTDHAGISTQMVVERELAKEGIDRHSLGREAFEKRVWEWKETYGTAITQQLRRLGVSCDWTRERFTLDAQCSRAVRRAFVDLHRAGLIYRDRYLVNWCPRCRTAISDLEVEHDERKGKLWKLRYPTADGGGAIEVSTTRPETMLGDTAVAVHPDDDRYRAMVGKELILPIVGRRIRVIADAFVDPAFGTGAVKVTPAHDANDFACGRRHGLDTVVVIGADGKMTAEAGSDFAGLDRFEARRRVVAQLEESGALIGTSEHVHAIGRCGKCDTVIEPHLSWQWFVRIEPLADPAIRAVESKRIEIVPPAWEKTYFEWMRNIHDWCISRQLWWGHRIPAYHCACGEIIVAEAAPATCPACGAASPTPDPDVLDTWFSSGLWSFATFGWPDDTEDLRRYAPTDVLVTGFDILFFWVARMIMMSLRMTGDVPFRRVYLHGLVRDEHNKKMSKTKGNVVDPLDIIDEYGADALRFTLAILSGTGRDIPFSKTRLAGYRAFATKVWNATRFLLGTEPPTTIELPTELDAVERWLLGELDDTIRTVDRALEGFRFDEAAGAIYGFVWNAYCDWAIEMSKPILTAGGEAAERRRRVMAYVLDSSLRLLHPFMPFVTEEIAAHLPWERGRRLILAEFPQASGRGDDASRSEIKRFQELVTRVRNWRIENQVPPGTELELVAGGLGELASFLPALARCRVAATLPEQGRILRDVVGGVEIALALPVSRLDEKERARLQKELERMAGELEGHRQKLSNPDFVDRAPAAVVERSRQKVAELGERMNVIRSSLAEAAAE